MDRSFGTAIARTTDTTVSVTAISIRVNPRGRAWARGPATDIRDSMPQGGVSLAERLHHFILEATNFTQPPSRASANPIMHAIPRLRSSFGIVVLLAVAGCRNPQADAVIYQQLSDAADQFSVLRQELALMSDRMDSLQTHIVRQDSLIRRIALASGFPIGSGPPSPRP
jgi:hypothetical protein